MKQINKYKTKIHYKQTKMKKDSLQTKETKNDFNELANVLTTGSNESCSVHDAVLRRPNADLNIKGKELVSVRSPDV